MNFAILEEQLKSIISKLRELQADSFKMENEKEIMDTLLQQKLTVDEFEFLRGNFPAFIGKKVMGNVIIFSEILDSLSNLDVIELIVPIETSMEMDLDFMNNFDTKISTPICVRITFDKSVVAGARIEYKGKIADYSIKKRLVEIFESKDE